MTLPFRRRHNDAEASHDRARSIMATGFLEPTEAADDAWLETHLASCPECRAELDAFQADRELLRSLRDNAPEAPRDLWARTAAAIEHEAGRHDRAGKPARSTRPAFGGPRVGRVPVGVLSGVLVVLVVIGTSLFPRTIPQVVEPSTPRTSDVAVVTPPAAATPLAVTANAVTWVEQADDGSFQLVFANVDEVCTSDSEACAPIADDSATRLTLPSAPEAVVLSPDNGQLAVITPASVAGGGGEVIVVPVPTPPPSDGATPAPTDTPAPTPNVTPTPEATLGPGDTPPPSIPPTQSPNPDGSHSILSGVVVVGEASYSPDGLWLAFSARPADGSAGPDLYIWRVGDPSLATAMTSDHRTFFAGWLGGFILASRVETTIVLPDPDASPLASEVPSTPPAATPKPGKSPKPSAQPAATPDASASSSPEASGPPTEDHPVSFLLDPATAAVIELDGHDIWRPVVDQESRTILYWSGTLVPDESGTGWALGAGRLVMDGWIDPAAAPPGSPDPSASPTFFTTPIPTLPPASIDPLATLEPTPRPGPAGSPVILAEGPLADFEASFDPSGTRLALWILDPANPDVGTLRLIAIDAATGLVKPEVDPLPGVAALRGFSIGEGRLAWVTPPGQDGEATHVHVLAWQGDEFGQVRSVDANRFVVVR